MSAQKYLKAYRSQRAGAKSRGIDFRLTFKEWCDFWGADIDQRGTGPNDLQMQRFADSGPYAIGNIRKGTPKQNAITAGHMRRAKASVSASRLRESELDALMLQDSGEAKWQDDDEHELSKLGYSSMLDRRASFAADK